MYIHVYMGHVVWSFYHVHARVHEARGVEFLSCTYTCTWGTWCRVFIQDGTWNQRVTYKHVCTNT
jgi:hypothetical protein